MGLFQGLLGNASQADIDAFNREWGGLIGTEENVVAVFKLDGGWVVFTDKRFIYIQNIILKRATAVNVDSIPYHQIVHFSVKSAGIMDLNSELFVSTCDPYKYYSITSDKNVNVYEIQAILADAISKFK